MFRKNLLLSTALILAGSAACAAQAGASAQTRMPPDDRDTNTQFLCTYGAFAVSAHFIGSANSSFSSTWTRVAVPIAGQGKSVSRIIVKEAPSTSTSSPQFEAGIYSNTANGPGKLLSGGTGRARKGCGDVTIPISPLILARKTTYWIGERVHRGVSDMKNEVYWASDPKTKLMAYKQTHSAYGYFGNSGSSTSPWTALSAGPYVRVR